MPGHPILLHSCRPIRRIPRPWADDRLPRTSHHPFGPAPPYLNLPASRWTMLHLAAPRYNAGCPRLPGKKPFPPRTITDPDQQQKEQDQQEPAPPVPPPADRHLLVENSLHRLPGFPPIRKRDLRQLFGPRVRMLLSFAHKFGSVGLMINLNFRLASLRCHLLVPSLIPSISPISRWEKPSILYRLNTRQEVTGSRRIRPSSSSPLSFEIASFSIPGASSVAVSISW